MGSDPNQLAQQQFNMGAAFNPNMGGMDPNMMMQMGYASPQYNCKYSQSHSCAI